MKIGILGGGQLGRMLAMAGLPLGFSFRFLDPHADCPASHLGPVMTGPMEDSALLAGLASLTDLITYEFENIPLSVVEQLSEVRPVFPSAKALAVGQDRLQEKTCFSRLKIPTPPYRAVDSRADLGAGLVKIGFPAVLKTRRLGYDGKGQAVLRTAADVEKAWERLGSQPLLLEGFVAFDREVSLIAVQGRDRKPRFYPLVENVHQEGILRWSLAPAPRADALERKARVFVQRLLKELDYTGVLAVEFFVSKGKLFANEMAPRVHNSGHWTIEGAETSQFENHLRAVAGLPLGDTSARGFSAMLNLIGFVPSTQSALALAGTHLHLYGKSPKPGRKLGHITVTAPTSAERDRRFKALCLWVKKSESAAGEQPAR